MSRLARSSILLALCLPVFAAPPVLEAPNRAAVPANQLAVAGNACGPAALLNAFRFGNPHWNRASDAIAGENDKQRISQIIRGPGMRPSSHIKGRNRWSRHGVNVADLHDMANDLTRGHYLPEVGHEVLFRTGKETQEKLLARTHRRLAISMEKGLPPVLSVRRHVLRGKAWVALEAHFVTVTSVPRKLEKGTRSFEIGYIDPWGGRPARGTIRIPDRPVLADAAKDSPCLEADFPAAGVGKKLVKKGESSVLAAAAALGRW